MKLHSRIAIRPSNRATLIATLSLASLAALAPPARANHGVLDPNFGNGGRVVTDFFPSGDLSATQELRALALQFDPASGTNKIAGAGFAASLSISQSPLFAVARYNLQDGSLDGNFGSGGRVLTAFTLADGTASLIDQANALVVDPSGRLIAAGSSFFDDGESCRFALARYTPEGQLDPTFANAGRALINVNTACDFASAVAIEPQFFLIPAIRRLVVVNKIVVAGQSGDPASPPTASSGSRFTLLRLNDNGTLDTTFGGEGIVRSAHFRTLFVLDNGTPTNVISTFDGANAVVSTGAFTGPLAVGTASFPDPRAPAASVKLVALARYDVNGSADATFGDGSAGTGLVVTRVVTPSNPDGQAQAASVRLQPDGKIVISGTTVSASNPEVFVARYNTDGSLDSTFGGSGIVTTNVNPSSADAGGDQAANALVINAAGNPIIGGFVRTAGCDPRFTKCPDQFMLVQFDSATGSPLATFGTGGLVRTNMPSDLDPETSHVNALMTEPDGFVVAGGFAIRPPSLFLAEDWALARYTGVPDVTPPRVQLQVTDTRLSRLEGKGLPVALILDKAATVTLAAVVESTTVARATGSSSAAGALTMLLERVRGGSRLLRGSRDIEVSITATATDTQGNTSVTSIEVVLTRGRDGDGEDEGQDDGER